MLQRFKILAFSGLILGAVSFSFAQGTLEAILSPLGPSVPPLAGYALVSTPDTSGAGPLYPVAFQININSDQSVFTTGRFFGGSTAWPFSLGSPAVLNGSMSFSGETDMTATQIGDMLAGRTQLEVLDEVNFSSYLVGPVTSVPEPGSATLFVVGLFFIHLRRRKGL